MTISSVEKMRAIFRCGTGTSWLLGHVDGASGAMLSGWAFSPRAPRLRLTVLVESGAGAFTAIRADRYRADVHHAGRGSDGYCGFAVPLRQIGWPGPFRVLVAEGMRPLTGSPWAATAPATPPPQTRGVLRFAVQARGTSLAGWVMDQADPFDRRRLRLECGGRLVSRASACLFDAQAQHVAGDGFHGFSVAVPPRASALRLIDEATGTALYDRRR